MAPGTTAIDYYENKIKSSPNAVTAALVGEK
jgi:hypothetical protein